MKIIRIGNDITIHWTITRGSSAEVFPAGTVVKLIDRDGVDQVCTYTVSSGVVTITYLGKDQKKEGVYRLLLQENAGQNEMVTLDYIDAFSLSSKISGSTMIGSDPSTIVTTAVNLQSQVGIYQSVYSKQEVDAMMTQKAPAVVELKSEGKDYIDDEGFLDTVVEEGLYTGVVYEGPDEIPDPPSDVSKFYSFKMEVTVDRKAEEIAISKGWYLGIKTIVQVMLYNEYYMWPAHICPGIMKIRYKQITGAWSEWEQINGN